MTTGETGTNPTNSLTPAGLAGHYAAVAAAWILLSGFWVTAEFDDPVLQNRVDMGKGMLFVAITSLLLYLLVRRWHGAQLKLVADAERIASALRESELQLSDAQFLARCGSWQVEFARQPGIPVWATWSGSVELRRLYGMSAMAAEAPWERAAIPDEDRQRMREQWDEVCRVGGAREWEHRILVGEDMHWIQVRAQVELAKDGLPEKAYGTCQDITERKAAETRIGYLASHDRLTKLPNRDLFYDRLSQAILRANRRREQLALLFMDLDGFKAVNDYYGHKAGDNLLVSTARRLEQCVRQVDTVARLGGDEFAVILSDIRGQGDAARLASLIIERLAEDVRVGQGRTCHVGVSIGIAMFPDNGFEMDRLMQAADDAMYQSKSRGRNTSTFSGMSLHAAGAEPVWLSIGPSHLLGIPVIDQQHLALAAMLNRLNDVVKNSAPVDVVSGAFENVLTFTRHHFETEERLMQRFDYPDMMAHQDEHRELLGEAAYMRQKFLQGGELTVLQALKDWFVAHIVDSDKSLASHLGPYVECDPALGANACRATCPGARAAAIAGAVCATACGVLPPGMPAQQATAKERIASPA